MSQRSARLIAIQSRSIESLEGRVLLSADHLAFLIQPTDTTAGESIGPSIKVALKDDLSKTITSDTSSVTIAILEDTGAEDATLSGTLTATAVKGVATFSNLSIDLAGHDTTAYKFVVTSGELEKSSSDFDVTPAAAAKLKFNHAPDDAVAGETLASGDDDVTVDVVDKFGNLVNTDAYAVTLGIATGPTGAELNGTVATATTDGEATFDDLSIEQAGDVTLVASAGKLTTAKSDAFTISAADAAKVVFGVNPVTAKAGATLTAVKAQIQDQFGNVVTDDTSEVTVAVASGAAGATLDGTLSQDAVAGVATFDDLSLDKIGTYSLSVADGDLDGGTSSAFEVTAGTASKLVIKTGPSNTTAGTALSSPVIQVRDENGNVVTTDTSKVTVAITDGPDGAKLTGTATATAVKGVATFAGLSLTTAGSYKLTFSDGSLASAVTSTFTISAAAAASIAFAQNPSNVTAGADMSTPPKVKFLDKFGNIATGDTSNVALSVATGPANPVTAGTFTSAASAGVATFSGIKFKTAGAYTLKAASGKLTVTSPSFTISAGDATQLSMSTLAESYVAGAAIPAITVQVKDANGNVVTTDTSTITIAIVEDTGPDGAAITGTATATAVKGVATFTGLSLTTAGTGYKLTVTTGELTAATSKSFAVTAAAASKLAFKKGPTAAVAGASISPAVTVLVQDKYGNTVTTDKSTVTLTAATATVSSVKSTKSTTTPKVSAAATASALGGTTTATVVDGVATFSDLTVTTVGSYTLTAADGKLTAATSSSFAISAGEAAKVAFGTGPATAKASATMAALTAQVQDQYGNLVTGDTSEITLAIASGPEGVELAGTLSADAVAGVATFSDLKIATTGIYTLSAAADDLTGGKSGSFEITPGTASKLVIKTGPSNTAAGTALSPLVVQVQDADGNVVTTDTSKVTVAISTGPEGAKLLSTPTATAVKGVANFTGLTLTTAGSYKLGFSDGSLTSAVTSTFTVGAAAAASLSFTQGPTGVKAGAVITSPIKVAILDKYGNLCTTEKSKVGLALATGPTGAAIGGTALVRASSGVATFSKIHLPVAGAYTIKATSGKLTVATSASFTITPNSAAKLAITANPAATVVAGVKLGAVTAQVLDRYGNLVTTDASTVTVGITSGTGPGDATITGTKTATAAKGIATFTDLTLKSAGTYRLSLTDGSLTGATTTAFTVNPAAAAKLVFESQPNDVTAGEALDDFAVDFVDAFGNFVTTETSKVSLSVVGAKSFTFTGTLSATAVGGVATFSGIIPKTAGDITLAAGAGKLPLQAAEAFTVSAAEAAKVVFGASPATAKAGATMTAVTAKVVDQYGNVVTDDTSEVSIEIGSGPDDAEIGGTLSQEAVAGVATFDDLTLETAGSYTLTITDGELTPLTSSSFDITAAAASKLVIKTAPADAVAGATLTSPVVQIQDAFGNVVTTDTSKVTVAVAGGPTGAKITGTATATAVKGVATFAGLSLTVAGTYSLKFTDGTLTAATSEDFEIEAAAASKLVFQQGGSAVDIDGIIDPAVAVQVQDKYGNVVTTDTSTVTIAIATGTTGTTLGGTLTADAVEGIATFDDLTLDKAGTFALKATDGSLTAVTSPTFKVT